MDSAPSAGSPYQMPSNPGVLGDFLSIMIISQERSEEFRASSATAVVSASGTAETSRSSDVSSIMLTTLPLDSTFEGFVLSRLMASESDDASA
jgi:hypothetical protein